MMIARAAYTHPGIPQGLEERRPSKAILTHLLPCRQAHPWTVEWPPYKPRLLSQAKPNYPQVARMSGIEGTVPVKAWVAVPYRFRLP